MIIENMTGYSHGALSANGQGQIGQAGAARECILAWDSGRVGAGNVLIVTSCNGGIEIYQVISGVCRR